MQKLIEMAAQMFQQQVGNDLDLSSIIGALQGLLPTQGGELDLAGLLGKFQGSGGGLMNMAQSWLGDGANTSMSAEDITSFFGEDAVRNFASKLDLGTETAANGLANTIPNLIDQCSESGALKDNSSSIASIGKRLMDSIF